METKPILLSSPLKFLVVDDSRAIQAIIRRAISKCGYQPIEVQTALNGEQALDLMGSFLPDLVITDWHMPKVSGLEMVQAMRQMGHQKTRVGFVTTERTPALLNEAVANGAMFILHKPFDDAELVAVVTAAVKDLAKIAGAPATATAEPAPLAPPSAAPEGAGDLKKNADPVTPEALQQQLSVCLGNLPFRLIPHEKMALDKLTPNILLGLYSANERKGVYAIGMLDANALCMVGGGSARKNPLDVRAAMATGHPDTAMMDRAHDFLKTVAECLTQSSGEPAWGITLAKASVVKNTFSKLAEVLAQPSNRSDFRLSIPGYGEGRMAFFVMPA
ncbi:MAG: response regulator [Rhodoferax sp.]|nr:response regulator [Rhodoferax sp.]MDP3652388.1 response regulator [Rhodoferax sp.]